MDPAPFYTPPPGGRVPDQTWWLTAADGIRLRAAIWRAVEPQAHAVYLSGRTEFLEKASVPAAALNARGYSVVSLDWRGQGLSQRLTDNPLRGHVRDFAEFQTDLDALLSDPAAELPGQGVLMGHSMGGSISAEALLRPEIARRFHASVLSAPMFGISLPWAMRGAAAAAIAIARITRRLDRWPPFGDMATPYALSGPDDNVLTHDHAFWDWMVRTASTHADLNLGMPTLGWFAAARRHMMALGSAARLTTPTLVLLGGDESVVDPGILRRTAGRLGADLADIPGGRHELLVEADPMRAAAWAAIDAFFEEQGLPASA